MHTEGPCPHPRSSREAEQGLCCIASVSMMGEEGPVENGGGAPPASGSGPPLKLKRMNTGVNTLDVDDLIKQLLSVKGQGPNAQVNLPEEDIRSLCLVARDVFLDQPALLQLATPIKICGDIHGQYHDLLRLFDFGGHPPQANYLFLGDYVDRGKRSLETISLLLCYKVKYPQNFFIMRGNHESASINRMYGFYDECKRRYSAKLWKTFTDCFNCLPIAAIVDDKIFCAHGGLSPELMDMEQINRIARPIDVPDTGLLCDLLWSDPDRDIIGWGENDRGVSFTFGEDIVKDFLTKHDLDLVCRAHQVVEDGYEFFAKRRLVTLFSAPNYCGEFNNAGAMMSVDDALMCSFQILQSTPHAERFHRKSSSANRGWLKNGPVGAARILGSETLDVSDEDPLLEPLPRTPPETFTEDSGAKEGVLGGRPRKRDVSSSSKRNRRSSSQRTVESVESVASTDSDIPAAFVPLPVSINGSTSSNTKGGGIRHHHHGKGQNGGGDRNRRRMASPPPEGGFPLAGGGVAGALNDCGYDTLASTVEGGGAPASAESNGSDCSRPGPTTPSPPRRVRPGVGVDVDVDSIGGLHVAEGRMRRRSLTSEEHVKGMRGGKCEVEDEAEAEAARQPPPPPALQLASALEAELPDAINGISRGGGVDVSTASAASSSSSSKSSTKSKKRGGCSSHQKIRRRHHAVEAEAAPEQPITSERSGQASSSHTAGAINPKTISNRHSASSHSSDHESGARRRRKSEEAAAAAEDRRQQQQQSQSTGADHHGHGSSMNKRGLSMGDRKVAPSSAGNGTTMNLSTRRRSSGAVIAAAAVAAVAAPQAPSTAAVSGSNSSRSGSRSRSRSISSGVVGVSNDLATARRGERTPDNRGTVVSVGESESPSAAEADTEAGAESEPGVMVATCTSRRLVTGSGVAAAELSAALIVSSKQQQQQGRGRRRRKRSEPTVLTSDKESSAASQVRGPHVLSIDGVDRYLAAATTPATATSPSPSPSTSTSEGQKEGEDTAESVWLHYRNHHHQQQQQPKDRDWRSADKGRGPARSADRYMDANAGVLREEKVDPPPPVEPGGGSMPTDRGRGGEDGGGSVESTPGGGHGHEEAIRDLRGEKRRSKARAREEAAARSVAATVDVAKANGVDAETSSLPLSHPAAQEYSFSTPPPGVPYLVGGVDGGGGGKKEERGGATGLAMAMGVGATVPRQQQHRVSGDKAFSAATAAGGGGGGVVGARCRGREVVTPSPMVGSSNKKSVLGDRYIPSSSISSGSGSSSSVNLSESSKQVEASEQQPQREFDDDLGALAVESPGTGTSTHSVETRLSQSSLVDSYGSASGSDMRRSRRSVLGVVRKGFGSVWEMVKADHPEPLPVSRILTKEEQKALHFREEKEGRNDWSTNSVAEQHQMIAILKSEEEKVWR